jgi:hypothetical protein
MKIERVYNKAMIKISHPDDIGFRDALIYLILLPVLGVILFFGYLIGVKWGIDDDED